MRPKEHTHRTSCSVKAQTFKQFTPLVLESTPSLHMYVCLEKLLKLHHPPKRAEGAGEEGETGTGTLGVVSVTPTCSSDILKPAHLSLPSEICSTILPKPLYMAVASWLLGEPCVSGPGECLMCDMDLRKLQALGLQTFLVYAFRKQLVKGEAFEAKSRNTAGSTDIKAIPQYINVLW